MPESDWETPLCVCGDTETRGGQIFARDEVSGDTFTYLICAACTTQRLSSRPTIAAIGRYYPKDYEPHTIRKQTVADKIKHLVYLAYYASDNRLGYCAPVLRLVLWPVRGHSVFAFPCVEPKRVFEFGAATGNDLAKFKAEGWHVSGCEPSVHACEISRTRGINLQNCPAEQATLPANSVSAVLINNVLEHVHDPVNVIQRAWNGLVPGGSIVIVVPNHAGLSARLFGAGWPGYDAPRHLWGFTPDSLAQLLRNIGFEQPTIYAMFQGRWAWRSSLFGGRSVRRVSAWRRRLAGLLSVPLLLVGILLSLIGHGDFITVVATRPQRG